MHRKYLPKRSSFNFHNGPIYPLCESFLSKPDFLEHGVDVELKSETCKDNLVKSKVFSFIIASIHYVIGRDLDSIRVIMPYGLRGISVCVASSRCVGSYHFIVSTPELVVDWDHKACHWIKKILAFQAHDTPMRECTGVLICSPPPFAALCSKDATPNGFYNGDNMRANGEIPSQTTQAIEEIITACLAQDMETRIDSALKIIDIRKELA
ncbi:hypothetical protein FNV43_RR18549 [Rhamnella rubrinervis]|uniref:Uncharacterized protein n=1 Tax=Rhamnella rubrinervis TaxID=2594499 RepID=A0A8K0E6H2_9ROSA|nr:hypothetical protein FNV43_RR18549 [Rhamnella rubrinervis]